MIRHVLRALAVALLLGGIVSPGGSVSPGGGIVADDAWAGDRPDDEDALTFVADLRLPTIGVDGEMAATFDLRGKRLLLIEFASW